MDITCDTFEEHFNEICAAINAADFVGIDCEFTGLRGEGGRDTVFDSLQSRYSKARANATPFMLTQFGLCCFQYEQRKGEEESVLMARPYNCYVRPASTSDGPDPVFAVQTSSIDFVRSHGFQVDRWLEEGVPFLSIAAAESIRRRQEAAAEREAARLAATPQAVAADARPLNLSEYDKEFVADLMKRVAQLLDPQAATQAAAQAAAAAAAVAAAAAAVVPEGGSAAAAVGNGPVGAAAVIAEADEEGEVVVAVAVADPVAAPALPPLEADGAGRPCFVTEPCNGFRRMLVHRFVGDPHPQLTVRAEGSGPLRRMRVTLSGGEEAQAAAARVQLECREAELRRALGFARVIEALSASGVPVVGHNALLDVCHTWDKFVAPLPEDLGAFARRAHAMFPLLFDTKLLLGALPAGAAEVLGQITALGPAYEAIEEAARAGVLGPRSHWAPVLADGYGRYAPEKDGTLPQYYHEAGFDAFITGALFAASVSAMGVRPGDLRAMSSAARAVPDVAERYEMLHGARDNSNARMNGNGGDGIQAPAAVAAAGGWGDAAAREEAVPPRLRGLSNRLFLMRMCGATLALPGPNVDDPGPRFLVLAGLIEAVRNNHLARLLRHFGQQNERINFHWIDDGMVVVECGTEATAARILAAASAEPHVPPPLGLSPADFTLRHVRVLTLTQLRSGDTMGSAAIAQPDAAAGPGILSRLLRKRRREPEDAPQGGAAEEPGGRRPAKAARGERPGGGCCLS